MHLLGLISWGFIVHKQYETEQGLMEYARLGIFIASYARLFSTVRVECRIVVTYLQFGGFLACVWYNKN
jgi:hypothetical protein